MGTYKLEKTNLLHIQANEEFIVKLKVLAAARNTAMYNVVNEALAKYFDGIRGEMINISELLRPAK